MSLWNRIFSVFSSNDNGSSVVADNGPMVVNPSTGLPMLGNSYTSVDYGGSPFGTNVHDTSSSQPTNYGCDDWMR
ncbi:hypothetical protein [Paraburkholderia dinghuensis]|uniref:Uncharacterized protein n=1 Tax=Paraburkholderia dinghuensis TaxID=2305225 RepID=A0A3N6PLK1_9BURK|nr:hypothetical protein [Paraburkholderia dinghuensis]RQG99835.1 hypothetical protein D1Y85_26040 [Paraburkholderia dinghuensis]